MRAKTGRDLPVEKIDSSNYQVPSGEEKLYHAKIEVKKFDPNTGQRQSIPRIQKFGSKAFKTVEKNLKKQGFTVEVLHDPSTYIAEQQKLKEVSASELAAKKKAAADEKAAAEKAALKAALYEELKAEILADLKKEGTDNKAAADEKAAETKAKKSEKN